MASSDPEKRAIFADEKKDGLVSSNGRAPRRRRVWHWFAICLAAIVVFSIGVTSRRCSAATSLFTSHGVPQNCHVRPPPATTPRTTTATTSAAAPDRTVLKTFEVAQPVLMPGGPAESDGSTRHGEDYSPELCTVLLMRHDFAWSYNAPFIGEYTPPKCEFNRVVLNFSVVSQGRQFDRLAIMYLGDTEVWRTSTAEPTAPPGISWIYLKDMTHYLYFWRSPQKIIFDLGNLIDDKYTGIFNTTMTAIFYNDDVKTDQAPPSDLIIPISSRQGANDSISRFILPAEKATNTISLPRNIRRAVFSVSANGQASEEFWWSNVLQTDVYTFNDTAGQLPGLSPFREVQVFIDGALAGVQWPFPVIFTGGVVPSLHRPIVGIHAFDLREHEIDITPFLGLLCDGHEHTFTIRVAGLDNTGGPDSTTASLTYAVNESWYVTGKLFLWLDPDPSSITRGEIPVMSHPLPTIEVTRSVTTSTTNGTTHNETLAYTTSVHRALRITTGSTTWTQNLRYTNNGHITAAGFSQANDVLVTGTDTLRTAAEPHYYGAHYEYPVFCNSSYAVSPQGNLSIRAHLGQGKTTAVTGASVFPTGQEAFAGFTGRGLVTHLQTRKEGTAEFRQSGDGTVSSGWGDAWQVFWLGVDGDPDGETLYSRRVQAVNGTLVEDVRRMEGRELGSGPRKSGEWVLDAAATEYA
ncbi:peptide N-acetyl-beta-D-glucosaminyl asparaginase amidase A-domain-containing protein [Chaetomium fimeti]|uniref:Peptide N-acetyl-beta-D-glucosaminyl asparaginase amidase A-domain-containing protein n=1 Tax=Chaetomium fimeti TaxID=1854472 RepID=A0AAE0LXN5_9PEZI|nr:peptide N-acetyl-beta-D-glucosaminyl asparaginase amidase A-domain-containing protein [Chaetomium fimeti]